jgi:O-acetylhomoserine/O-acetylserine sulfhydrylase-like pyridoxal-dependent enzyme
MRKPWVYDPAAKPSARPDAHLGFATRALHAGFHPLDDLERFRSLCRPSRPSMTYPYQRFDQIPYPVYGRTKTPTTGVLEERLASLEGGEAAVTAASGSQALFNLISTLARPGDNVVTSLNTFGEGYKQAATIFPERCHVEFRFVPDPGSRSWDGRLTAGPGWSGSRRPATRPSLSPTSPP